MAVKEKKVVQSVLICDYCSSDIVSDMATRIEGKASGYMKRESLELDLCENCANTVGLKRRGRRPGTENTIKTMKQPRAKAKQAVATNGEAPKKRGRPKKVQAIAEETTPEVTAEAWL